MDLSLFDCLAVEVSETKTWYFPNEVVCGAQVEPDCEFNIVMVRCKKKPLPVCRNVQCQHLLCWLGCQSIQPDLLSLNLQSLCSSKDPQTWLNVSCEARFGFKLDLGRLFYEKFIKCLKHNVDIQSWIN